jgi:hypothetical protein
MSTVDKIDISGYIPGIYFLKVYSDNNVAVFKNIKQ